MTKTSKTNNKAKSKKQAGGTLLGLIVGLILGLSIAVGVAMVIYKTPLPFTNKGATQDRSIPAAGELADPNKPLYGKKPPVNQIQSGEPAPTVAEETIKPSVADKATQAKEKIEAAKAEAARAESAEEKWIYYLQAGAFRETADAESMKAKLALMGFEATVSERQAETGTLHRVRIGPFGQLETMNRVRTKLSDNGVDVAVVRIGK